MLLPLPPIVNSEALTLVQRRFVITVALTVVVNLLTAAANAEVTVVTADALLDVRSGRLIDDPLVLVEDDRIVVASQRGLVDIPDRARRIQLTGQTLVPGLIDMHVHLTSDSRYHGYQALALSDERQAILGVANALKTLQAGFTTVRNVGASSYGDVALRDAIAEGDVPGPRLLVSGPPVGITGGHCSDNNLLPAEYEALGEGVADGPWAARAAVRRNIKYGVDLIKTCSTGGVMSKGTQVGAPQYTVEELKALADEAHNRGLKVAAHAHGAQGIINALEAGIDTIEHASFIDDRGIRLALQTGAYLTMDIYVTEYILGEGEAAGILPESLEKERQTGSVQRDNFRKAHKAGVKMLFGTDAGIFPHGDNARQFSRMTQFGMTPIEAIRAATSNAAEALGMADRVGQIKDGFFADMIAVKGNPLNDITVLEHPSFVMKAGTVYRME